MAMLSKINLMHCHQNYNHNHHHSMLSKPQSGENYDNMVVVVTQQTKFRWSNTFQVKCNDGQNEDDDNQVVELEQRKLSTVIV